MQLTTNGPFTKRQDRTEYAIMVDGKVIDVHMSTHEDARSYRAQWLDMCVGDDEQPEIHIVHRRVVEQPYYLTTP